MHVYALFPYIQFMYQTGRTPFRSSVYTIARSSKAHSVDSPVTACSTQVMPLSSYYTIRKVLAHYCVMRETMHDL